MPDVDLIQEEADMLRAMAKRSVDTKERDFPGLGEKVIVPLISIDESEHFDLDLYLGRRALKLSYQNRGRRVHILARLDLGGPPHRNPNGEKIHPPHLHLYREGSKDFWAFPVSSDKFKNLDDPWLTLHDFMTFCNIIEAPIFKRELCK